MIEDQGLVEQDGKLVFVKDASSAAPSAAAAVIPWWLRQWRDSLDRQK